MKTKPLHGTGILSTLHVVHNGEPFDAIMEFNSGDESPEHVMSLYSDRLYEWDREKYNDACRQIWNNQGQMFYVGERSPEETERFLQIYTRDPELKLLSIFRYTNQSNGYDVWRLDVRSPKNAYREPYREPMFKTLDVKAHGDE